MRPFLFILALALALPIAAAAAESGQCEYRHPDRPAWNFLAPCTLAVDAADGRSTTVAEVANGSRFTVVEEGAGGVLRFTVNGQPATRLEGGASRCYLTDAAAEKICIHPAGAEIAPQADDAATGPAFAIDDANPLTSTTLGGGEKGVCLAWVESAARTGLIEQGACVRREDCAIAEASGKMGCIVDFAWESGRTTAMTKVGEEATLDGAVATPGEAGCFTDAGAGLHFCFIAGKMTAEVYPALALPPAPEPEPLAPAAPAAATSPPPAPPVPVEGTCSYLRDEAEISSWACTETAVCEPPLCTVTYALANDTTVTLDAADGKVVLMNGARTEPVRWQAGRGIDVLRPGAPYTFRFAPGAVE